MGHGGPLEDLTRMFCPKEVWLTHMHREGRKPRGAEETFMFKFFLSCLNTLQVSLADLRIKLTRGSLAGENQTKI